MISRQIDQLKHCALVLSDKSGQEKQYFLNLEVVEPLSEILKFHTNKYCPGQTECISPEKLKDYLKKEARKEICIEH